MSRDYNFEPITNVKYKSLDVFRKGDVVEYRKSWLRNTGHTPWDSLCHSKGVVQDFDGTPWVRVLWGTDTEPACVAPSNIRVVKKHNTTR